MTDYERDLFNWRNSQSKCEDFNPKPNKKDYDSYGYKKGQVVDDGDLILDKFLVDTYGVDYARQHPLEKKINIKTKTKYQLKNIPQIEAIKWSGKNIEEVESFCRYNCEYNKETNTLYVPLDLNHSYTKIPIGHYIAKEIFNQFVCYTPEYFESKYELIND